jgi:nucleoside-diphosphate-sugar epimerase
MSNIHVIGGSGFIGTCLVGQLLAAGHKVAIVDKATSRKYPELCVLADVRDLPALTKALEGAEVVYNLAAEHKDNVDPKSLYDDVNVQGARNVCAAMEANGITRLLFTSSVAVYGFAPRGTGEAGAINHFNDYGRTKWEAEEVYRGWLSRGAGRSLVVIRPTVVFGENNRGNVYNLFHQMAEGAFMMIGKGTNVKSMAYVANIAGFLGWCLRLPAGEHLYNYVDKPDADMNSLVLKVHRTIGQPERIGIRVPYWIGYSGGLCFDLLAKIVRRKFPISAIRVKKFCSDSQFGSRVWSDTDYRPVVSLEEGIERTLRYEFVDRSGRQEDLFYSE